MASGATGNGTAQGGGSATGSVRIGAGGVVTLGGSGSVSASASQTGVGAASASSLGDVLFQFEIATPHAFTVEIQLTETGANASARFLGSLPVSFPGSGGSQSGVLAPGVYTAGADIDAGASRNQNNVGSQSSSASFSFTLTLTPQ
jgi:hypothetical protein